MIPGRYFRYACLITALANGAGNLGLMLFYRPLLELVGVPLPEDLHYFFWMAGLSFTNGILAYYIYLDPERNHDLLKVGIVGKGFFSLMTFYFYIFQNIHWFFLLFGVWDALFVLIFWLYLIQLQAPSLSLMNRGDLIPGNGPKTHKAVILSYSLTGTGSSGAERMKKGLESGRYYVDIFQISPVEKNLFRFPFGSAFDFLRIAIRAILRRPARIEPLNLPSYHDYDLIIVESQTWFVGMSAPVEAIFQDETNRSFFSGRDAALFIVCRGLWRRSQAMLLRHLERCGAHVIGAKGYTHAGWEPSRLFTLAAYLTYGETGRPVWLRWLLQPRYGLSDADLQDIEEYGKRLAER